MASGFPGAIDNFSDPLANSPLNSPSHATLHSDVNDAVEKIETYMGLVYITGGTMTNVGTTGQTVSNAFSSLYRNYRLMLQITNTSQANIVQMQLGASAATYFSVINGLDQVGSATSTLVNNGAQWNIFENVLGVIAFGSVSLDLFGPQIAALTPGNGNSLQADGAGVANGSIGLLHNTAASYTSFKLFTNAGTFSCVWRLYGYRD